MGEKQWGSEISRVSRGKEGTEKVRIYGFTIGQRSKSKLLSESVLPGLAEEDEAEALAWFTPREA